MHRSHRSARRFAPVLVAAALGLTACGSDPEETAAPPALSDTEHNDADVAFATDMIPHHAQALVMVDMTRGRELSSEMTTLVEGIRETQAPEIELMVDWLTEWGEDIPETSRDHVNAGHGGDHGGMDMDDMGDMPGMMSDEDLDDLEESSDSAFEDMWLQMMIAHHEGAIEMAEAETESGQYRPTVELAEQIIDGQSAEITTMEEMLAD